MLNLFMIFFKIGLTAFGGGSVIISLIRKEFVDTGLISVSKFVKVLALSQATPGPIAGSVATYIGYQLYGLVGIIVANIAIVLPSFLIVILFSTLINKIKNGQFIDNIFKVLRPITLALIIFI